MFFFPNCIIHKYVVHRRAGIKEKPADQSTDEIGFGAWATRRRLKHTQPDAGGHTLMILDSLRTINIEHKLYYKVNTNAYARNGLARDLKHIY